MPNFLRGYTPGPMIYVIDAYNVIHAVCDFERKLDHSLKAARDYLEQSCRHFRAQRGDIEKIFLIFDGSSAVAPPVMRRAEGIEPVYTESGEDADDRLIEVLMQAKDPGNMTVVSNDNYVTNHARALGANVMTARDFYVLIAQAGTRRGLSKAAAGPGDKVPAGVAQAITAEYRKHLKLE